MLRTLMLLFCLFVATNGFAQGGKTTEKQPDPQIDYKQMGAPMPPLRLVLYQDTAAVKKADSSQPKDATVATRPKKKKGTTVSSSAPVKVITNKDVNNGANLFLMLFNPTCSHCEEETIMLQNNMALFKKSKILMMVTPMMQPYLGDFVKRLMVDSYPFMQAGVDSAGMVNELFLYQALPQLNIYNHERKLIKIYSGEVSIDSLKKYIE